MVLSLVSHFLLDYFKQSKQRGKRKPQKETKESTHFSNKVVEIVADEIFHVHNPWIAPKQPKSTHTIPRSIRAFELFLQNDFMTRSHGVAFGNHWVTLICILLNPSYPFFQAFQCTRAMRSCNSPALLTPDRPVWGRMAAPFAGRLLMLIWFRNLSHISKAKVAPNLHKNEAEKSPRQTSMFQFMSIGSGTY